MHVKTHQSIAISVYDSLPRDCQEFLRFSDVELKFYARVPDEISHDNIAVFGGCSIEEAHAHSYKLEWDRDADSFTHLTGSVPTVIAQTTRLVHNSVKEGNFNEAREHLGKLLHYTVDATTIWHLTRELTPEDHKKGEAAIAKIIDKIIEHPGPLKLPYPKSLYKSTIAICEDTIRLQLDRVLDGENLMAEMVDRCQGFALSAMLLIWGKIR